MYNSTGEYPIKREIEVEGHLIDSMILTKIFDRIMDLNGDFEVLDFRIGKKKKDYSYALLSVSGKNEEHLETILKELFRLGATIPIIGEVKLVPAPRDMVLPNDFYSTTNHPTSIIFEGKIIEVENLMMDKPIIVSYEEKRAFCKPIRFIRKGDLVVVGELGIRIKPPERPREGLGIFEFMTSKASSEKPSSSLVRLLAKNILNAKKERKKIVVVAGPAVIHTGAAPSLAKMIHLGYVDSLLSGNALAVHDVEFALYGTSLGMKVEDGSTSKGNKNHLMAINEISKAGSLKRMVEDKKLTKGIFFECIVNNIPFALAGSIRDDGPIPDVITDVVEAQKKYIELIKDAEIVLMFASMLHSIAVGNLLSSNIKVVCVDINQAVATKLIDRGTAQAIGIVSDVGTFIPLLVEELENIKVK